MKKLVLALSLGAFVLAAPAALPQSPAAWTPADFRRPSEEELKKKLTPLQFNVTQKDATERAFSNEYWNNKAAGIYVDVVSGQPLFSSLDKYDSGTGWPSFTKPIEAANVKKTSGRSFDFFGVEVRSSLANSHLGHVFQDGPPPTGLRYCINSAALRFVSVDQLAAQGYAEYLPLFGASAKR
jgi:peptide-methionine (R)-S-oxide reductase/peptide methionine sulfoxide reductase msrA/msrB